ncbi:MAG: peptidoglycan recognition family protein [Bacteroidota bacterium]
MNISYFTESIYDGMFRKYKLSWIILCLFLLFSCREESKQNEEKDTQLEIIDKPIKFDSLREALSLEYLKEHHGLIQETPDIIPKIVVVHHTVIPTLEKTFEVFDPPTLAGNRAYIQKSSTLNVSSQFSVDQDGKIYRFLPDTTFARHVIGLNYCAIGIENVGGTDALPLTKAQIQSNILLIRHLVKKYPIEYVIGHHEYQLFIGHPLWKESDPNYLTDKNDPGEEFMSGVRAGLQDLSLKALPKKQNSLPD